MSYDHVMSSIITSSWFAFIICPVLFDGYSKTAFGLTFIIFVLTYTISLIYPYLRLQPLPLQLPLPQLSKLSGTAKDPSILIPMLHISSFARSTRNYCSDHTLHKQRETNSQDNLIMYTPHTSSFPQNNLNYKPRNFHCSNTCCWNHKAGSLHYQGTRLNHYTPSNHHYPGIRSSRCRLNSFHYQGTRFGHRTVSSSHYPDTHCCRRKFHNFH